MRQAVHQLGGYRMQRDIDHLLADATAAADAGAFAVVLECVPQEAAATITAAIHAPTIGIGAGPHCDGQVLVLHDLIGLSLDRVPKFVRPYASVKKSIAVLPCSRPPKPVDFIPPNGTCTSPPIVAELMCTIPTSISSM